MLPEHPGHHRPLRRGRGRPARHLRLHRRHPGHVAPRFRRPGLALPRLRQRGRRPPEDGCRRHQPPVQMHPHRPVRQRVQCRSPRPGRQIRLSGARPVRVRAQVGDRLALLPGAPRLRVLEEDRRHLRLRRPLDGHRQDHPRHLQGAAAEGGPRQLHLPAEDRPPAGHQVRGGPGQSGEARRPHRLVLPSLRRRHDLRVPGSLQLHGRHHAPQDGGNPRGRQRPAGNGRRVRSPRRRGGAGATAICRRGPSRIREDLCL